MLRTRVQTSHGALEGKLTESSFGPYISFKGIPYAKPPFGKLRFAAPQPMEPWDGIKEAFEHGDNCLQHLFMDDRICGSEDCLYLNIYTRNVAGCNEKKYPVMFFIHGGAFKAGSGDTDLYGPDYLLNHEVVVVTFNYRLNVFGFLSVDTEDVPGNAGLKDQAAALKWVKANISNFGGDPENITIFGESAGSASVTYHLFSPLSKGLFHAAIAQSGVYNNIWATDTDPVNRAFRLGKSLGISTKDKQKLIDFLRTVPASDLLDAVIQSRNEDEIKRDYNILFRPVVEKIIIPDSTFLSAPINELFSTGKFNDVPLILGYNSGEGIYFVNDVMKKAHLINEDFSTFVSKMANKLVSIKLEDKINEFYFDKNPIDDKALEKVIQIRSDFLFVHAIYMFGIEYSAKATSLVYFDVFSYNSELNIFGKMFGCENIKLTCHGDDLNYIFKAPYFNSDEIDFSSESGKVAHRMMVLWTNMAKYKNPTPKIDDVIKTTWVPIQGDAFYYLLISDELELRENPNKERMDLVHEVLSEK